MSNHKLFKYQYSYPVYFVETWCTKYQDTRKPCAPNPIEMSVSIIPFLNIHSVAELLYAERDVKMKIVVRCSI